MYRLYVYLKQYLWSYGLILSFGQMNETLGFLNPFILQNWFFPPFTYCFISSILLFSWIQFSSWKLARHKLSLCYMSQVIITSVFCSRAGRYVKTAQKHIVMKIANMNDDIKGFANKEPKQSRHKIKTVSANIFYSRYKKYLTAMK